MAERSQHSNILLAFISLTAVIVIVSLIGFFTLGKGPEIIQGQAEADEYRVSSKVPGRILEFRVKEGDKVKAGDTLAILEAPDVKAKLSQAQAAEQAAQALNEKAQRGTRQEQLQAAYEIWQKAKAGVEIAEKSYNRVNPRHITGRNRPEADRAAGLLVAGAAADTALRLPDHAVSDVPAGAGTGGAPVHRRALPLLSAEHVRRRVGGAADAGGGAAFRCDSLRHRPACVRRARRAEKSGRSGSGRRRRDRAQQ